MNTKNRMRVTRCYGDTPSLTGTHVKGSPRILEIDISGKESSLVDNIIDEILLSHDINGSKNINDQNRSEEQIHILDCLTKGKNKKIRQRNLYNPRKFLGNNLGKIKMDGSIFITSECVFTVKTFSIIVIFNAEDGLNEFRQSLVKYGFKYESRNEFDLAKVSRSRVSLDGSPFAYAPQHTIRKVAGLDHETVSMITLFKDYNFNTLEEFIIHLDRERSLRVELRYESTLEDLREILNILNPRDMRMTYHGVFSQNYDENYLLFENEAYDSVDDLSLQAFILPIEDTVDFSVSNFETIILDRSIFFNSYLVFGLYDSGINIYFFRQAERDEFVKNLINSSYWLQNKMFVKMNSWPFSVIHKK